MGRVNKAQLFFVISLTSILLFFTQNCIKKERTVETPTYKYSEVSEPLYSRFHSISFQQAIEDFDNILNIEEQIYPFVNGQYYNYNFTLKVGLVSDYALQAEFLKAKQLDEPRVLEDGDESDPYIEETKCTISEPVKPEDTPLVLELSQALSLCTFKIVQLEEYEYQCNHSFSRFDRGEIKLLRQIEPNRFVQNVLKWDHLDLERIKDSDIQSLSCEPKTTFQWVCGDLDRAYEILDQLLKDYLPQDCQIDLDRYFEFP